MTLAPWVTDKGHFAYERYVGGDKRYPAPKYAKMDTFARFTKHVAKRVGTWPITGGILIWAVGAGYQIWWTLGKADIWLNRSVTDRFGTKIPPWDWERDRDRYWKNHSRHFYDGPELHRRDPLFEKLQEEMVEAAKARGTR